MICVTEEDNSKDYAKKDLLEELLTDSKLQGGQVPSVSMHEASENHSIIEEHFESQILDNAWFPLQLEQQEFEDSSKSNNPCKKIDSQFETGEMDPFILKPRHTWKQNKNTPRFLMRLGIKQLPCAKGVFDCGLAKKIKNFCREKQLWHLSAKKNVYLLEHLEELLTKGSKFNKEETYSIRMVMSQVLREHSLCLMKEPKSQIKKNRIDYLRCAKIYALRCRHQSLVERNQCQ